MNSDLAQAEASLRCSLTATSRDGRITGLKSINACVPPLMRLYIMNDRTLRTFAWNDEKNVALRQGEASRQFGIRSNGCA